MIARSSHRDSRTGVLEGACKVGKADPMHVSLPQLIEHVVHSSHWIISTASDDA
jgi:hypothetical protein